MSPALQLFIAQLSPAEKLQLVGELWDQLTDSEADLTLTPEQEKELRAEREAIRRDPHAGSTWSEVRERIIHRP